MALGELRLDRGSLGGALLDDARLLRPCAAQLLLPPRNSFALGLHLLGDRRVLVGDALTRLEASNTWSRLSAPRITSSARGRGHG